MKNLLSLWNQKLSARRENQIFFTWKSKILFILKTEFFWCGNQKIFRVARILKNAFFRCI